jgi:hypothetical protein
MAGQQWKAKEYFEGWTAQEIADDITAMERSGWAVEKITEAPSSYEISRMGSEIPGLNDGDSVDIRLRTRVWYKK